MLRRITRLIAGVLAAGLLLALAPSASATTTYDITQVGDASWVGITDSNENDATKTPLASNGANVRVTFGVHIEDMSRLAEGDTVTVPFGAASGSHYGLGLFGSANLPRVLRNRNGVDMFTLTAPNAYTLTMTRTSATAVGSFDGSVTVATRLWWWNPSATSSTWMVGNSHSITFFNRKHVSNPCTRNSGTSNPEVSNSLIDLYLYMQNCQTMTTLAKNGDTSSIGTDDQITWFHVSAETGRMVGNDLWAKGYWVQTAYDENTPGATYDTRDNANYLAQDTNADVSTFAKTRTNLKPGHYAIRTLSDGSLAVACNYGSRLPGQKNSLQVQNKGNGTTLKLLAKTGHIWQNAQFGVKVHFADESVPNRVKVETQSTESAYQTTTLTTKPLDPAIGAGQSAIRYDPNGGDGDAFRKAGDPGATATTAETGVFLRKGHTFAGWNTKADGTGTAYQAGADVAYPAEGDTLTLYAQWKRVPETTMPDTGGTMNHRRLTTMLGGACPHGPSVRPHAPAQAGLSHARRVMGHAEAHHPQTGHPCRSGRPAVRTRPVHARGAHRPRRRGIAAGDIHGIGQVVGARPETVRGREARTVGFIRPAGPVGRRAVGRVGVGHGGHLPVLRHFRHAADGHAGRRDVGHAAHGRERARLAVVPVRRLHQVRVV